MVDKKYGNLVIGSNDKYEYLEKIVETGGLGDVYKARQIGNGEVVALKALKDELFPGIEQKIGKNELITKNKTAIDRAKDESEILRSLQHKNIVRFIDVATDIDGSNIGRPPLLVMEYLQGVTLGNIISDAIDGDGLDAIQVLKWFQGYLLAVEHCHKNGFIHRDIKPGNLFIKDDDTPVLSLFPHPNRSFYT